MKASPNNATMDFNQILNLVKKLSKKEKLKLSRELERDIIGTRLTLLLKAFKTEELSQNTIDKEVEMVRTELYAKSKSQ